MTALDTVSSIPLALGVVQAGVITAEVVRRPQTRMPIMNVVWPLVGLYVPDMRLAGYLGLGRAPAPQISPTAHLHPTMYGETRGTHQEPRPDTASRHPLHDDEPADKPLWPSVVNLTTPYSSGCSLGDIMGTPLVFWLGLTILGSTLFAEYAVEFGCAYILGIAFQYYGMGLKTPNHPGAVLKAAMKADTLSLVCFEIRMLGWMALVDHVFFISHVPQPNTAAFWFRMQ